MKSIEYFNPNSPLNMTSSQDLDRTLCFPKKMKNEIEISKAKTCF